MLQVLVVGDRDIYRDSESKERNHVRQPGGHENHYCGFRRQKFLYELKGVRVLHRKITLMGTLGTDSVTSETSRGKRLYR